MSLSLFLAGALAVLISGQTPPTSPLTSVGISPIGIDQSAADRTAVVTLTNRGADPVVMQVRLFEWTQVEGVDTLIRTDAVIASPPIATVQPGQSSLVRIVRVDPSTPAGENAYRLWVDEVPQPTETTGTAIQLAIRHSIPVFFHATGAEQAALEWRVERDGDQPRLRVSNSGNRHVQLSAVVVSTAEGPVWSQPGLLGYVLPGSTMEWDMPDATLTGSPALHIEAQTDRGPVTIDIPAGG